MKNKFNSNLYKTEITNLIKSSLLSEKYPSVNLKLKENSSSIGK